MKVIVGLGNPGEKYKHTRHNVGFMAVDFILNDGDAYMEARPGHEFKSDTYTLDKNGEKIIFLKPQTYMNDSGQALRVICNFYKLNFAKDMLVIHDDVDLPFGTLRGTESSSAAGHNGILSIINDIGTQNFGRLRVGIESREAKDNPPTNVFVLENFTDEELSKLVADVLPRVRVEIEKFIGKN